MVGNLFFIKVGFEVVGDFIVEASESRSEATMRKVVDDGFVCFDELMFGATGDWASMDGVGVIVVQDEDIFVPAFGWTDEFSSLVREDFSRGFLKTNVDGVGSDG